MNYRTRKKFLRIDDMVRHKSQVKQSHIYIKLTDYCLCTNSTINYVTKKEYVELSCMRFVMFLYFDVF